MPRSHARRAATGARESFESCGARFVGAVAAGSPGSRAHKVLWPDRGKRRVRTTDSKHTCRIAPKLLARNFSVDAPNKAWMGDITYVATPDGWLHLAVVLDLYARKVVGWAHNAVIESFFATLNTELGEALDDLATARGEIGNYIDRFYGYQRLDSNLGYVSPADYEPQPRTAARAV